MIEQAHWLKAPVGLGDTCPLFLKSFVLEKEVKSAKINISALGVYEAKINGNRIGDFIFAPGWTSYHHRVQVQEYEIGECLAKENALEIVLGKGWCFGELTWENKICYDYPSPAIICALCVFFTDGTSQIIYSDESFEVCASGILFSDIYDGEIYDSRPIPRVFAPAAICDCPKNILTTQQGEQIQEIEHLKPESYSITDKNEHILDFGQNIVGYVKFKAHFPAGTVLELSHGEVLKEKGAFKGGLYTENLRSAMQKIIYIANGEESEYKPHFTFQGFRYVRLDKWPATVDPNNFTAVVVHSNMKRTGFFDSSHTKLNKLFDNIVRSQKGNFVDVPTDCPQRDERLGWTGDAQAFVRAASYNFDVMKFFAKWLADLSLEQFDDGGVPAVVPDTLGKGASSSSAWGDAAIICPWQLYLSYGNKEILESQFESMEKWVNYIRQKAGESYIWSTGHHFGDWLALDAGRGNYSGATPKDFIATAYFAYSTGLFVKSGMVLRKDMSVYQELHKNIVKAFQGKFIKNGALTVQTQTAHALALYFDLCGKHRASVSRSLDNLAISNGNRLTTGFVGTPYLLHALSQNGYSKTAYSLLLQEEFPSWLYSVNQGATTIWEHWDGINEDKEFWDADMNSFNHYAYGAVADWMYGVICGINTDEKAPGFENAILKPIPDRRLSHAEASIETKYGTLTSKWTLKDNIVHYEFTVPNKAIIIIGGKEHKRGKGKHEFQCEL